MQNNVLIVQFKPTTSIMCLIYGSLHERLHYAMFYAQPFILMVGSNPETKRWRGVQCFSFFFLLSKSLAFGVDTRRLSVLTSLLPVGEEESITGLHASARRKKRKGEADMVKQNTHRKKKISKYRP